MFYFILRKWNNNITPKHVANYVKLCIYGMYCMIKMLIANKFRLLFIYNADSIRDFTSLGDLRTFTESVVFFRRFPNTVPFLQT